MPKAHTQVPERVERIVVVPPKSDKKKGKKDAARGRGQGAHADERGRDSRAKEAQEENELFARVDENQPYTRSASLHAPAPLPGMRQRWIYVGMGNALDAKNLAKKLRDGWRARASDTVPKSFQIPRVRAGKFAGTIMVEGMLLCHMPEKMARKRDEAIRADTLRRTKAVDENLLRVNQGAGGGFGPVKKGEKAQLVREAPKTHDVEDDVDLTT